MSNFLGVKVVHPIQDLLNEAGGLLLTQRLLLGQEVEQLSSRHSARHQQEGPVKRWASRSQWVHLLNLTPSSLCGRIPLPISGASSRQHQGLALLLFAISILLDHKGRNHPQGVTRRASAHTLCPGHWLPWVSLLNHL